MKYPENERILVVRPCLKTICLGVKPAAKLLSALLYQARNCPDEEPSFTIQWTQEQVIKAVCEEFTSKTLHDTAIPCLELLGYLEVDTSSYVYQYMLHLDLIHRALEVYNTPVELEKFLIVCIRSQLEKVLNELEKLPNQLEEVLIQLEKLLIVIRKTSNSKRGRKARAQATLEDISENPRLLEIDKNTKREEESKGEQSDTATSASSLPLDAAISSLPQSEIETQSQQGDTHATATPLDCPPGDLVANQPRVPGEAIVATESRTPSDLGEPLPAQPASEQAVPAAEEELDATLPAGTSSGSSDLSGASMAPHHPLSEDLRSLPPTSRVGLEAAPEIDEEWCTAETEHRLPAIPKHTPSLPSAVEPGLSFGPTPSAPAPFPGLTSHEQNRDAIPPRSVAVEADSGCTAPQVPPGVAPNNEKAPQAQGRGASPEQGAPGVAPLSDTKSVPASTRTAPISQSLTPSQSGVNSGPTDRTTDLFSQESTKAEVAPPRTMRATVVSPPPQVLVVSQQFTSVEDWKQAQDAFVEQLRGIWKTASSDFKRQAGNWNAYRKQYLDRWLRANPDPSIVQFTPDGKALFDEWCSLFKVTVEPIKANIEAANWLAEPCATWAALLDISRVEVLRTEKDWCYANDKKGYFNRGVKLFDLKREFEGWQSYQQSLLDKAKLASKTGTRTLTREELRSIPV